MNQLRQSLGKFLASFLTAPIEVTPALPVDLTALQHILHPADVILVEGNLRISAIIKYLTQSTWSHAALYIGGGECIEADVIDGVRRVSIATFSADHLRICRPIRLTLDDRNKIIDFAISRLGAQYDLKHVFDLARYLIPLPVPRRWRRRALSYGSADPSRAICSTLVAQAFQTVNYPILPDVTKETAIGSAALKIQEIYHIHDCGLFVPRDFDLSPFFHVIKPDMPRPFDHHNILWSE